MSGIEIIIFVVLMALSFASSANEKKKKEAARAQKRAERERQNQIEMEQMLGTEPTPLPARPVMPNVDHRPPTVKDRETLHHEDLEREIREHLKKLAQPTSVRQHSEPEPMPYSLESEAMARYRQPRVNHSTSTQSSKKRATQPVNTNTKKRTSAPVEPQSVDQPNEGLFFEDFDPAKAIIYSEIMQPKYIEY